MNLPSSPFQQVIASDSQQDHVARQAHIRAMAGKLLQSDAFAWFLDECVAAAIKEQQTIALESDSDSETAKAKHARKVLQEKIRDWVPQQYRAANEYIVAQETKAKR